MNSNLKNEVKTWYHKTYPTDSLYTDILSGYTFEDLFYLLDRRVYSYYLFACDSLVRERIFEELSKLMNVEYSYIHNQWSICECLDPANPFDVIGVGTAIKKIYSILSLQGRKRA